MTRKSEREHHQGKGRNLGQGLANITDQDRRDLAPSGDAGPARRAHLGRTGRGDRRPQSRKAQAALKAACDAGVVIDRAVTPVGVGSTSIGGQAKG